MERLPFSSDGAYSGVEAAIHVARYALARNLCRGKKVLDVACGEGYGSRLLLNWGAAEVVGVDISADAIESAHRNFQTNGIRYLCGDAQKVDQLLEGEKFDLIISIETIEHLERPHDFLAAISQLRANDAAVLLSCPNDWWYYPNIDEGNRYHIRKYFYGEFIELVSEALGTPDAVGVGVPSIGFINLSTIWVGESKEAASQIELMKSVDHEGVLVVPADPGSISVKNASYFLAAWGISSRQLIGAAMLPVSMDFFSSSFWQAEVTGQSPLDIQKREIELKLRSTEAKLEAAVKEIAELSRQSQSMLIPSSEDSLVQALSQQLEEQRLATQKYRNQANALFHETTVLQQALANADLTVQSYVSSLAEKDRVLAEQDIYLKALLKRWNFVTALPRMALPPSLITKIKKSVRWFKGII